MDKKTSSHQGKQTQVILVIIGVALLLPLALLGYGLFKEVKNREISRTATTIVEGLRESIQLAADKKWEDLQKNDTLLKSITLQVHNPQKSAAEVSETVTQLGGQIALSLPEETSETSGWRMLIQIPKSKETLLHGLLNLAPHQDQIAHVPESLNSPNSEEEMQNIEIHLEKKTE